MNNRFSGPPLPLPALIVGLLITGFLIFLAARRLKNAPGNFVLIATWFRYIVSAFQLTATTMVGPFSLIALSSLAIFGVGLMFIKRRLLALSYLLPVYFMCGVVLLSAVLNESVPDAINVIVKYGFLIVITLCTFQALTTTPDGRFARLLLFAFAPLIVFQIFGLALGVVKNGENDGSASNVGGYAHEATFSVMLVTMLLGAALTTKINPYVKFGVIVVALVGIYLANYRTSIIAVAPLLAVLIGLTPVNKFPKRERPFITAVMALLACAAFGVAQFALMDRFQDISIASSEQTNLFKPPNQYTEAESRILSGRPIIWAGYVTAWLDGDTMEHMFGFGPESWTTAFRSYAHNTLVCTLYEYGIVGVIAMLFLWLSMLAAAFKVRHPQRNIVIGAHVSFLVLNQATQPMWMLEGIIMYGLLCGYTLFLLHQQSAARRQDVVAPAIAPRAPGYGA